METMVFLANTMLPSFRDWWYAGREGDPASKGLTRGLSEKKFEQGWEVLEKQLEGREYLVGDQPSTADFLAALTVKWRVEKGFPPMKWGNAIRLAETMMTMESWKEVCRREGLIPELLAIKKGSFNP